ncbi:MAG: hypothetical protein ACR2G2_03200 [Pseudonocardia sp.]
MLDRDYNAALNLATLAVDTGELRREQPAGTDVRRAGKPGAQSDRLGKSRSRLNVTAAR